MRRNKQKRSYIIFTMLILSMLLLPSKLFAEKTNNDRTLTLLGNESLSPIVYNDNGTAKGVAVDIAKAIGDSVVYDIHVILVNGEKAQLMLLNGDADGLLDRKSVV